MRNYDQRQRCHDHRDHHIRPALGAELAQYPPGPERAEFAVTAMKIGVMALRQAQGRIDAEQVRREGDRFIENLGQALTNHQKKVTERTESRESWVHIAMVNLMLKRLQPV